MGHLLAQPGRRLLKRDKALPALSAELKVRLDLCRLDIVQGVQGVDESVSTLGWSLSIDKASGQIVAAGAGENAGFVIFGACTPI